MAGRTYCIGVALILSVYEYGFVDAQCPRTAAEAESAAKVCLSTVGLNVDPRTDSSEGKDVERLRQYCSDGTLDRALDCVGKIMEACQQDNSEVKAILQKSISIERLRGGFKYMCRNIEVLVENAVCISKQTKVISDCVAVETRKFQEEIQMKHQSQPVSQDEIWAMSCGFMGRVFSCQDKYYRLNCGNKVADVLTHFMQSVTPPVCSSYTGSAGSLTLSWMLLPGIFTVMLKLIL